MGYGVSASGAAWARGLAARNIVPRPLPRQGRDVQDEAPQLRRGRDGDSNLAGGKMNKIEVCPPAVRQLHARLRDFVIYPARVHQECKQFDITGASMGRPDPEPD